MKAIRKRFFIFILVIAIAVFTCGITAFATIAVDHYLYANGITGISDLIKNINDDTSVHAIVDFPNTGNNLAVNLSSEHERVLNIWEYSAEDGTEQGTSNHIPLENIQFAIFEVCSLDDYYNGIVDLNTVPTEDEINTYAVDSNHVVTVTTDENGYATYSFGYGENDGVYMVVELENAAVSKPIEPFYVSFPMSNADNTDTLYTINVYPKNDIEYTVPMIDKDITSIGNKFDSFGISEANTWIIRGSIPSDIADSMDYSVSDCLDPGLSYVEGSLSVRIASITEAAGAEKLDNLKEITDYTVSFTTVDGVEVVSVSLTSTGMENVAALVGENYDDYEIRIYLDTVLNSSVDLGFGIQNGAELNYKNAIGQEFFIEVESIPEIYTGGLNILKVDSANSEPLAGAKFKIAREASAEEIKTGNYDSIYVSDTAKGVTIKKVVYLDFYNSQNMSGDMVSSVVTDKNGVAYMYGLAYGTYYLVETEAPKGYSILTEAVEVVINDITHLDGNRVKVINSAKSILPSTDDIGSAVFNAAVVIFFVTTVVVILSSRKKKTKNKNI